MKNLRTQRKSKIIAKGRSLIIFLFVSAAFTQARRLFEGGV